MSFRTSTTAHVMHTRISAVPTGTAVKKGMIQMSKKKDKDRPTHPSIEQVSARAADLGMSYGQYTVSNRYKRDCLTGIYDSKGGSYSMKNIRYRRMKDHDAD